MLGSKNYIIKAHSLNAFEDSKGVKHSILECVHITRIDGPIARMSNRTAKKYDANCQRSNRRVQIACNRGVKSKAIRTSVQDDDAIAQGYIVQKGKSSMAKRIDETRVESLVSVSLTLCTKIQRASWKVTMCKKSEVKAKWTLRLDALKVELSIIEARLLALNAREVSTLSDCKGTAFNPVKPDCKHARKPRLEVKGSVNVRVAGRPSLGHIVTCDYFNSQRAIEARCWSRIVAMDCGY